MHETSRRSGIRRGSAAMLALLVAMLASAPVAAAANPLTDGIAPGVVQANAGFGDATVIVPANGYVTYLVHGAPALAGTPLEIWTSTGGSAWTRATTRTFAADGTVHYAARITARTSFQGRIPGTPGGVAHGQSASTWGRATDRRTQITVGCDVFVPDVFARPDAESSPLVWRTIALKSGARLDVVVCSNASTGFGWEAQRSTACTCAC